MTEPLKQSQLRSLWERRPQIIKVTVYPARHFSGHYPPSYIEYIVAWGGKWRWTIRKGH